MDSPAISPSDRAQLQQRQMSLWYAMLLTGVVGASYIPLAYWGIDGLLLCVWLVLVGLASVTRTAVGCRNPHRMWHHWVNGR